MKKKFAHLNGIDYRAGESESLPVADEDVDYVFANQKKGFDVLGIDVSLLAIKVCKLRGLKKARALPITQISARLGRFDTLLMLSPEEEKALKEKFEDPRSANEILAQLQRVTDPDKS